jgi:hypothetical protein
VGVGKLVESYLYLLLVDPVFTCGNVVVVVAPWLACVWRVSSTAIAMRSLVHKNQE